MSYLVKSSQINFLSNKDTEDFLSDDEDDDFNFKYVPANYFKHIVKDVQRKRCKEDEERIWATFVNQQDADELQYDANDPAFPAQNIKDLIQDSMNEVDRELRRLEEDALPERRLSMNSQQIQPKVPTTKNNFSKKQPIMKDTGTGSTNILLPIPEERHTHKKKVLSSKRSTKTNTTKSSLNHIISPRNHQCAEPLHERTEVECNSSLELSMLEDNKDDDLETLYVRPDPLVTHKILTMQKKTCDLLDEILYQLDRIPVPESDKDLKTRQQRVVEFATRFSRNYLYDLGRLVNKIQRHMSLISSSKRLKCNRRTIVLHMQVIEQKLVAAQQLLLQSLIAYCKHIPSSVVTANSAKLKELLRFVIDLKNICDKILCATDYFGSGDSNVSPLGNDVQDKCNALLSKLKTMSDNGFVCKTRSTPHMKHRSPRKHLSNRLSMYSMDVKMPRTSYARRQYSHDQKRKNGNAAEMKITHSSRSSIPEQPNPSPITHISLKSITEDANTNYKTVPEENDVETMMDILQMDPDCDNNSVRQESLRETKVLSGGSFTNTESQNKDTQITELNSVRSNDEELVKKVAQITEEHLSSLVPVIADLMSLVTNNRQEVEGKTVSPASMQKLMKFLKKYQCAKNSDAMATLSNGYVTQRSDHDETKRSQKPRQKETNMQLIYMANDDKKPKECNTSESQKKKVEQKKSGSQRSRSDNAITLTVPEETISRFCKWRSEYERFSQQSPMYNCHSQNKPWDIVSWIADKLINELLVEISKELQMEDVIKRLLTLEFQEY